MFRPVDVVAVGIVLLAAVAGARGSAAAPFECEQSGNFLDVHSHCTAYYNCRHSGGAFVQMRFRCDYGMLYSKEEERCLTASNLMCRRLEDGTTESYPTATTPSTVHVTTEATTGGMGRAAWGGTV